MAQIGVDENTTREDPAQDRGPDSNWIRVSRDITHESGIPPAAESRSNDPSLAESGDHLDQVLSETARTEANLRALVRGLNNLTAGATAVLDSTGRLASELDAVREAIAHASRERDALRRRVQELTQAPEEGTLRQRVQELTQALEQAEHKAYNDLRYVVDQQDLFLADFLTEHEQKLEELTKQRDQARDYALRCERERDLAWQELGAKTPAPSPSVPPAATSGRAGAATQPPPKRISSEYSLGAEDLFEERVESRKPLAELKGRG